MQHSVGANVGGSLSWSKAPLPHDLRRPLLCIGRVDADNWEIQSQIWIQKNNSKNRIYAFVDAAITRMSMVMMRTPPPSPPPAPPSSMRPPSCYFNSAEKNRDHSPDCGRSAFLCLEHYVCFCDPDRMENDCRDICAVCECQEGVWYNNPRNQASLATSTTWPRTS